MTKPVSGVAATPASPEIAAEQPIASDTANSPPTSNLGLLANLPTEIVRKIGQAVDPRSAIALAGVSQYFRAGLSNEREAATISERDAKRVKTAEDFQATLERIQQLPASLQGAPLAALGKRIRFLPEADRTAQFDKACETTEKLPAEHHGVPLGEIVRNIAYLPEADRTARFDRIFAAAENLPAEHRGASMAGLGRNIYFLPDADLEVRFGRLQQALAPAGGS
ncbi:hypothetical protein [Burkholderia stabilis]|uniref:F-box domain-containing protein n=1 Tax=Burkholderia stabilis TaxID=95485 RepID=A0AAJ5NIS7_9BURK|nr:hypothetical protein [Burkholderia stabilis]VBB16778.1 hypothetical protein BSTAB16_6985 [Burkholderia stabilis]